MKKILTGVILVLAVLMFSSSWTLAKKSEPIIKKVVVDMINEEGQPETLVFMFEGNEGEGKQIIKLIKNKEEITLKPVNSPPYNSEILSIHYRNPTCGCSRWGCGCH